MRTMEAVKADIQSANESLRTMFPKGNLDGITDAKRAEFDALNEHIRALDTEAETVMAAADAEARTREEDAKRQERLAELMSRGQLDRAPAPPAQPGIPPALRSAMDADECPDWLREFYEGEGLGDGAAFRDSEHSVAFRDYLRSGSGSDKARLREFERALSTDSSGTPPNDTGGGVLVPEDNRFMNTVVESMKAYRGVERVAMVFTTSHGRPIPVPRTDDTGNDAVSIAEATKPADALDMPFTQVVLDAHKKGTGRLLVSTELIEDSGPMIERLIGRLLGKRIGRHIGEQLATGDGNGENLRGILNQAAAESTPILNLDTNGVLQDQPTALSKIVRSVDIAYRQSAMASIVFSDDMLNALRTAVNANSNFLYPMISNIGPDNVRRMDGMRVIIDPNYPAFPSAAGDVNVATVGDHSEFYVRKVRGMRLVRNPFSHDDTDQVKFNMWHRCDSALIDLRAVRRVQIRRAS